MALPQSGASKPDISGNPLHPTSNPKQVPNQYGGPTPAPSSNAPRGGSLMDDDRQMNSQMGNMSLHQPLTPAGQPIKRTDTETSDTDVFVDAQG